MALGAMTYVQKANGRDDLSDVFDLIRSASEPRTKKLMVVSADHDFRAWCRRTGHRVVGYEEREGPEFRFLIRRA